MLLATPRAAEAIGQNRYILDRAASGAFTLVRNKAAAPIYVDPSDWPGVVRAVSDLDADIARVTGVTAAVTHDPKSPGAIDICIKNARIDAEACIYAQTEG